MEIWNESIRFMALKIYLIEPKVSTILKTTVKEFGYIWS